MAISRNEIDNILNQVNIVDIIGKYIDIQKKGRNYIAVCPFHDDSDPSLSISQDKKIFKCFVCGVGGNVITFVEEFNNVTFLKAISLIAKDANISIAGLKLVDDKPKYSSAAQKIFDINNDAAKFFNGLLITKTAKLAKQYLEKRNIKPNEINKFLIGFVPKNIELYNILLKKGHQENDIIASGLFYTKGVNNRCVFENRIVFPITDDEQNIIGFSGRAFIDGEEPKYKNSSENLVFKKSHLAYNFANARKDIRINDEVIILEGFMDVISLERIDIHNSVAIMGTSFTDYHVKLFSKFTKNFKLFLDGDDPGIKAALKAAKFLMDKRINVQIIYNNTYKDPDELVVEGNANLIKEMIKKALSPIDFVINYYQKKYDLQNSWEIKEFIDIVTDVISHESSEILRESSIERLSKLTNIDKEVIKKQVKEPLKVNDNVNEAVEYVQNYEPIDFENAIPDFNKFIPRDKDFYIDDYYEEKIPSDVKLEESYIKRTLKLAKRTKNLAEASIVLSLIKSDIHLNIIEKNINKFDSASCKIIVKRIIEEYRSNNYIGNDYEAIENIFEKTNQHYYNVLKKMKKVLFLEHSKVVSQKAIEDMFYQIELYKQLDELSKKAEELKKATDQFIKKELAENFELLSKNYIKFRNKGGTYYDNES
ncbi:DNA primase [Spiroplasma tabanidicola]|uniref:DNA primase n=1 Tax=Spiroplasma tabanidicola TaxID=324079 RepID=A0A6I6C9G9_9MOLU|nr:DNA primase [Spiroplasma tabanidicola]QGS52099.1 DNA primase [Spiroplasma tabanidicola]